MTDLSNLLPGGNQAESLAARLEFANEADSSVADEFEGLFMSLVLKEMRKTVPGGGLFGGDASDTYGGMFDLFMGQHLARSGGIGIREMVNASLAKRRAANTYLANAKHQ